VSPAGPPAAWSPQPRRRCTQATDDDHCTHRGSVTRDLLPPAGGRAQPGTGPLRDRKATFAPLISSVEPCHPPSQHPAAPIHQPQRKETRWRQSPEPLKPSKTPSRTRPRRCPHHPTAGPHPLPRTPGGGPRGSTHTVENYGTILRKWVIPRSGVCASRDWSPDTWSSTRACGGRRRPGSDGGCRLRRRRDPGVNSADHRGLQGRGARTEDGRRSPPDLPTAWAHLRRPFRGLRPVVVNQP
jgi:hypothetical protein